MLNGPLGAPQAQRNYVIGSDKLYPG